MSLSPFRLIPFPPTSAYLTSLSPQTMSPVPSDIVRFYLSNRFRLAIRAGQVRREEKDRQRVCGDRV